jgi:hypothetical protein
MGKCRLVEFGSVAGSCEHGNELSNSIKHEEFLN